MPFGRVTSSFQSAPRFRGDNQGGTVKVARRKKKPINEPTVRKIVVGIQVASAVLEINEIIGERGRDREERIVRTVVRTIREVRRTLG